MQNVENQIEKPVINSIDEKCHVYNIFIAFSQQIIVG